MNWLIGRTICGGWARRLTTAVAVSALAALGPALAADATTMPAPTPANTAAPTVSGTPAPGQTLTCSTGSWSNNPSGYTYAWLRNGSPIAGQTGSTYVVQSADQGSSIACRVTASNGGGEYTIGGLTSGSYTVFFSAGSEVGNYLFQYFSGKTLLNEATPVSVSVPNTTTGINAALATGGQISGQVTAGGGPVAGAEVCAFAEGSESIGGGCVTASGTGAYTISSLPTGVYAVTFYPSGAGNYLSQTHSGVSVTAPNTTTVNGALATGGQINGHVTAAIGGAPLAKIEVCAEEQGAFFGGCATTNGSGEYTVSGLASGSYTVSFYSYEGGNYQPQYYKEKPLFTEAETVSVTAGSTTPGINGRLLAGGQISGKVSGAVGGGGIEVCAFDKATDDEGCALTNANGEYTISSLVEGTEFKVVFLPIEGSNYLDQYYNGKTKESEATPVSVTPPKTTEHIDAVMVSGGQIAGRVTAASGGAGLAHASVCAEDEGVGGGCTTTNSAGEYAISALPTGTYIVAVSYYEEGGNYQPQSVGGVSVTAPNTTPGINLALPPGGEISGRVTAATGGAPLGNVLVCASNKGNTSGGCATTNGAAGGSATATSSGLTVPGSQFTQVKSPKFNAKTDVLEFFFKVSTAGTFRWSLFFKNADVGFADSLGMSLGAAEVGPSASAAALGQAAKKGKKKGVKCKKGQTKHRGKCVHTLISFSSGSQKVPAGTVTVKTHPSSKALHALRSGHTLHVSGTFTFQSASGGPSVTHSVSAVVRMPKKKGKGKHRK